MTPITTQPKYIIARHQNRNGDPRDPLLAKFEVADQIPDEHENVYDYMETFDLTRHRLVAARSILLNNDLDIKVILWLEPGHETYGMLV